jgi:hypothetical protein
MPDGRLWRWTRWAAMFWGLAVAAVTAVVLLWQFGLWPDSRLPAAETARQLRARLGVDWTFSCTREEGDETIPGEIDYYCRPSRDEEVGYFVETDSASIQIVSRTG